MRYSIKELEKLMTTRNDNLQTLIGNISIIERDLEYILHSAMYCGRKKYFDFTIEGYQIEISTRGQYFRILIDDNELPEYAYQVGEDEYYSFKELILINRNIDLLIQHIKDVIQEEIEISDKCIKNFYEKNEEMRLKNRG